MNEFAELRRTHKEIIARDIENDTYLTGEETYGSIGQPGFDSGVMSDISGMLRGFPVLGGCLEKALLAKDLFGGRVVVGAMRVFSAGLGGGVYGFDFNFPEEFHCWVDKSKGVLVDLSLPGVILRGMRMRDEYGPIIVGREPAYLIGVPPEWLVYKPVITLTA